MADRRVDRQKEHHYASPGDHVPEHLEPRPLPEATARKSWTPPQIEDLPSLEPFTLQASAVGGLADGGPSLPSPVLASNLT